MKKIVIFITLIFALVLCMASCELLQSSGSQSVHTHEFGEWSTTENATCTNNGVKVRYCSCGESQSDTIPKLSHNVVIDAAVTSTCTKAGLTEGKHCSVCNETIIAQTIVYALGHAEVVDASVPSTCTTTGLTEGKHCSVCNETLITQIETAKANHSYDDKYDEECNVCGFIRDAECPHTNVSTQPAKSATCTEPGLTEGKVCVKCEAVIIAQTIIDAKGHTEVVDAAVDPTYENTGLSEGKHCSACGTIIIAQQVIPMLQPQYHTIWYKNIKTADYPTVNNFVEHLGLNPLPEISVVGYEFIGWYTEPNGGGQFMNKIPKGSTEDITLYAHWNLLNYEITYINVPNNTNPTSYSIEDKLKLQTPTGNKLVFTHWSDDKGNTYTPDANITFLPEKMTGDLILTAHWKVLRNIATPAEGGAKLYSAYSGDDGFLYFFYDLGTIEHVVLDEIDKLRYKAQGEPLNVTLSKTVTISEETAKSIANTVSKSVSSTTAWESTHDWSETHTENWNAKLGASVEAGVPVFKVKVEGSYGWGGEDSNTDGWTKSNSGSNTGGETTENAVSSSIAYKQEITTEITENNVISADMPSGYYAYVHAGNVRVIAVISYEIATGSLYLDTYSRLDNMHSMIMYYENVNQLNNPSVEGLDFAITDAHKTEIVSKIDNSYYVKYDANGGAGTMPTTMHTVGATETLPKNTFTKDGYGFVRWELITDNGVKNFQDGQEITNLGDTLETVTLKAIWEPLTYTVVYDANGGTGTMPPSTHPINQDAKLSTNTFTREGYEFVGWILVSDIGEIILEDEKIVKNLAEPKETITLHAKWSCISYIVKYDANGGTGSMPSSLHYINEDAKLASNTFTKESYIFVGWKLVTDVGEKTYHDGQIVKNLANAGDTITLYAMWDLGLDYSLPPSVLRP